MGARYCSVVNDEISCGGESAETSSMAVEMDKDVRMMAIIIR